MAAVSYVIGAGGTLETVTTGTNAPSSGILEIRFDQTSSTVTDAGSTRAPRKSEIYAALVILMEYLVRDTTLAE